ASAPCAALSDSVPVVSCGAAMRRSRMPVRVTIHSSEVSTIRSRSALVRTCSGSPAPHPVMAAFGTVRRYPFPAALSRRHAQTDPPGRHQRSERGAHRRVGAPHTPWVDLIFLGAGALLVHVDDHPALVGTAVQADV